MKDGCQDIFYCHAIEMKVEEKCSESEDFGEKQSVQTTCQKFQKHLSIVGRGDEQ